MTGSGRHSTITSSTTSSAFVTKTHVPQLKSKFSPADVQKSEIGHAGKIAVYFNLINH